MRPTPLAPRPRALAAALAMLAIAGCAIDVDLASSPDAVDVGQPVTFDVSVRNRATCPVGGVVAVLVPFIPRDFFISQIADPELRAALSAFVDAFCSGMDVEPPDGAGDCRIENGELICDIIPAMSLPGPLPEAAVATTDGGEPVTCGSDGTRITCRFPSAVLAQAQQASAEASPGMLQCQAGAAIAACGALLLDPNETKSAQVALDVPRAGVLRNWVVAFATVRGGVCTGGALARRPCDDDGDCTGMTNLCADGMCSGGDRDGYGCEMDSDCPDCSCVECTVPDDGQLLTGVACTTTASALTGAPAMSPYALLLLAATLGLIGGWMIHRRRRA